MNGYDSRIEYIYEEKAILMRRS